MPCLQIKGSTFLQLVFVKRSRKIHSLFSTNCEQDKQIWCLKRPFGTVTREKYGTKSKELQFFTVVRRRSEEERSQKKGFRTSLGHLTDQNQWVAGNYTTPSKHMLYMHIQWGFIYLTRCQSPDDSRSGTATGKQKTAWTLKSLKGNSWKAQSLQSILCGSTSSLTFLYTLLPLGPERS